MNFYNDIDPNSCAWMRQLVEDRLIPDGDVSCKSITDITPDEIKPYTQQHFFCGIAGWPKAIDLAGWPRTRPIWSASLPCQPFSIAGRQRGDKDDRHLWPEFIKQVRSLRPEIIFGEQVSSAKTIGRSSGKKEGLQYLQNREDILGVLRELQGPHQELLQRLRQEGGENQEEGEPRKDAEGVSKLEKQEPREGSCDSCKTSGEAEGIGVRPKPRGNPKEGGHRGLRNNRNTIQPDYTEILGCSVFRQEESSVRLHDVEYEGGALLCECDDEHMGRAEDFRDCVGDQEDKKTILEQFIRQAWSESPESFERCWIDGVQSEMAKEGYAIGFAVLGAHSVGAPHRRQRIYWVARNTRDGGVGDAGSVRCDEGQRGGGLGQEGEGRARRSEPDRSDKPSIVADSQQPGLEGHAGDGVGGGEPGWQQEEEVGSTAEGGAWDDFRIIHFKDGSARRTKPGIEPMADGLSKGVVRSSYQGMEINADSSAEARKMRLHGYGNSVVLPLAVEFIRAVMEEFSISPTTNQTNQHE